MNGVTFDSGALIAADRGERRFWQAWKVLYAAGIVPTVPATVIGQVWRDGARQARLAGVLKACRRPPLDERLARRCGELCGRAGTSDLVDASVVLVAADRGEDIVTSDPTDLRLLGDALGCPQRLHLL